DFPARRFGHPSGVVGSEPYLRGTVAVPAVFPVVGQDSRADIFGLAHVNRLPAVPCPAPDHVNTRTGLKLTGVPECAFESVSMSVECHKGPSTGQSSWRINRWPRVVPFCIGTGPRESGVDAFHHGSIPRLGPN